MKTCKVCKKELDLFSFPVARKRKDGSYNYRPTCKQCTTEKNLLWYHTKGGKERQKQNSFKNNLKKYGITPDEYQKMFNKQDGKCAICDSSEVSIARKSYNLFVDHDHQTGKVRGLLCHHCNAGLGYFRDNEHTLHKAIEYLNESRS
jgi:hypothetical protein